MNEQKYEANHNAYASNDNVCYSQERIFATEPRCCRENHSFCTTKHYYWVCCKQHKSHSPNAVDLLPTVDLGAAQSSIFGSAQNFFGLLSRFEAKITAQQQSCTDKLMNAPTGPITGRSCRHYLTAIFHANLG